MLRRAFHSSLILLSLWLAAGPLALLQLGAWSWMLASYSQESSIEQAFRETFGGDRPCELCKVIDSVEEAQTKQSPSLPAKELKDLKLMLGLGRAIEIFAPEGREWYPFDGYTPPSEWTRQVPTPPPRTPA